MKSAPTTSLTAVRPTSQTPEPSSELQEQIRLRAYELFEQRGREDGHDVEDWLQAETEVSQKHARTVAA